MKAADFKFDFESPIVCTAIHNGHDLSPEVNANMALPGADRLREEDPYTERFVDISGNTIIGRLSRFDVDLNRRKETSIYLEPKDCWGLVARKEQPSPVALQQSSSMYDDFYEETFNYFKQMEEKFGKFFVFDIHSYNHHRLGTDQPFDDPDKNPEVILGTSNMTEKWFPLVKKIQEDLKNYDYFNDHLDVRINVKYPGGNFPRWIHTNFPNSACVIALEFKKTFMDEWTGEVEDVEVQELKKALASTLPGILEYLKKSSH